MYPDDRRSAAPQTQIDQTEREKLINLIIMR